MYQMTKQLRAWMSRTVFLRVTGRIQTAKEQIKALGIAHPLPPSEKPSEEEQLRELPACWHKELHEITCEAGRGRGEAMFRHGCRLLSRNGFGLGLSLNLFVLLCFIEQCDSVSLHECDSLWVTAVLFLHKT